jgi:hypothetical protein
MDGSAALAGRSFLNLSSPSQRLCFPIKCMFELPCPDLTRSFRQLIFPWRIALCYVVVCVVLSYSSLDFIFVCGFTHLCHQMFFLAQPQRFLVGSNVTALSPLCSVPSLDSCCVVLVVRESNSDVVFGFVRFRPDHKTKCLYDDRWFRLFPCAEMSFTVLVVLWDIMIPRCRGLLEHRPT